MKSYRDSKIELSDNRLTDFDVGYAMAPLSLLLLEDTKKFSYSDRMVVRRIISILDQIGGPVSILVVSDELAYAPLLVSYFDEKASRISYFLGQPLSNIKLSLLAQDLASQLRHITINEHKELVTKCLNHEGTVIAIVDAGYVDLVRMLSPSLASKKARCLLMPNYASKKSSSLYFDFQKSNLYAMEFPDNLGEVLAF